MPWPIGFSIPEELIVSRPPPKKRKMSAIIPGIAYSFDEYEAYSMEYGSSQFGLTWKKAGWDCLRHYEIVASGAIPWFLDLDAAPEKCMPSIPRWLCPSSELMKAAWESDKESARLTEELLCHARENMTCPAAASRLLKVAEIDSAERVLYVRWGHADYLCDLTLIGMKKILGDRCVEWPVSDWLYDDFSDSVSHLYGRGFCYTKRIPASLRTEQTPDISEFDAIIWGSWSRSKLWWEEAKAIHPSERLVRVIGEDWPYEIDDKFPTFVREWR